MAELPKFTPLGHGIWFWKPWRTLESLESQKLWLALYTSAEAKRSVPGLWPGSLGTMSDITEMSSNTCWNALDHLCARNMAVFDQENRLVRLPQLPDALDRAHNDKAIWGWWSRYRALPEVPLRDAHVPTLWWMIQSGKCTDKMVEAWKQTFGTITVPKAIPSFRRLSSYDTGTAVQPSLFGSPPPLSSFFRSNEINNSDPRRVLPGTTPGGQDLDLDLRSGLPEAEGGGSGEGGRPHLQLVPDPPPPDYAAEVQNERSAQMSAALREAAAETGTSWLLK